MFYPSFQLSKKERLSVIWLAANYDPDKYKKIIPARDCENANIAKICQTIMNPSQRLALRLSAQLMLGTVRVYRTKTKLVLELAEHMMLKLSTLIKEASLRNNLDLPISVLRSESITMADTGLGIIDYSLEPVFYDPQMIMHINEDDFFATGGGSPIKTPVKADPKKQDDKKLKSPLQVSNRQISISEDHFSPHRPIFEAPGEAEFSRGDDFGPATESYFDDLNMADEQRNRVDEEMHQDPSADRRAPTERMGTVFEEDEEMEIERPITSTANRRQRGIPDDLIDDVDADNEQSVDDINRVRDELIRASRNLNAIFERDAPEVEVGEEANVNQEQLVADEEPDRNININIRITDPTRRIVPTNATGSAQPNVPTGAALYDASTNTLPGAPMNAATDSMQPDAPTVPADGFVQPDVPSNTAGARQLYDETDENAGQEERMDIEDVSESFGFVDTILPDGSAVGEKGNSQDVDVKNQKPGDWERPLNTPAENHYQVPKAMRQPAQATTLPVNRQQGRQRRKRKLLIDERIHIDANAMRRQMQSDAFCRRPVIAGTNLPHCKELFSKPIFYNFNALPKTKALWENNTREHQKLQTRNNLRDDRSTSDDDERRDERERSPEATRHHDDTGSSIDIPRAGSSTLHQSVERTGASIMSVNETPGIEDERLLPGGLEPDYLDPNLVPPMSPRLSGIGILPQDSVDDFDLNQVELEPIQEIDGVQEEEEQEAVGEQGGGEEEGMINPPPEILTGDDDDDGNMSKHFIKYQRDILRALQANDGDSIFTDLYPHAATKKRDAAFAFYTALNLHKNQIINMKQESLFGDIFITRVQR